MKNYPKKVRKILQSIILDMAKNPWLYAKHPEKYRHISSGLPFDFLDLHTKLFYSMQFRIVRFQIAPGVYEAAATNLPLHLCCYLY